MGFCSCTVKYLLFFFNFLVVLCGIAIIVVGALANSHGAPFKNLLSGEISASSIALIVIGAVVFCIAFMGCCGAIRENSCMVTTYAIFLMTILIVEIVVGVLAFVYRKKFETELNSTIIQTFNNYHVDQVSEKTVDDIQKALQCCGIDGPSSYSIPVPSSCCSSGSDTSTCDLYKAGCKSKIIQEIKFTLNGIGIVAIVVAVVEIAGVIFGLFLASAIRRQEKRGYV